MILNHAPASRGEPGGNMVHGPNGILDGGVDQIGVFAFLEGPLLLDLDIGGADRTADGIDALDAALKILRQDHQLSPFRAGVLL